MDHQRELDLAWAAGLFDGEGSVYVALGRSARQRNWRRSISLNMTDEATVMAFAEIVGYPRKLNVQKRHKPNHRPTYQWQVAHRNADDVLLKLVPYLRLKVPQAEICLFMGQIVRRPNGVPLRPEDIAQLEGLIAELQVLNGNHSRKHTSWLSIAEAPS